MSEELKPNDYLINEINNYFKLPIYYNKDKTELKKNYYIKLLSLYIFSISLIYFCSIFLRYFFLKSSN